MLERIAAGDMVVSVTVGMMPGAPEPPPAMRQRLAYIVANHGRMFRAGATMVPGTDAGVNPAKPHDVMPHALQALVDQVGMTPQQALRAATSVAAKAVGRGSKGRIAAGADADVLVVQGNALADMTAVTNVSAVFKGGIRIG